jgi:hypothetical protein
MATNTKLPFISVLLDQELEKHTLTQKLELVNHDPLGIMDLTYDALISFYIAPSESSIQEPSAPSAVVPEFFGIAGVWSELSQITYSSWVGLPNGFQSRIIIANQNLFRYHPTG